MTFNLYKKARAQFIHWLTKDAPPQIFPPCDFSRIRQEIRPGDVILVEGRSRVSDVIARITGSPWTHAALYIGRLHDIEDEKQHDLIMSNIDRSEASSEPDPEKLGKTQLIIEGVLGKGTVVSKLGKYRHDHVRICRPKGLTAEDAEQVVDFAIQALGKQYDVRQILDLARFLLPWSILPRRWGSSLFRTQEGEEEKEICSSVIAEAFAAVKFPILPFIKSIGTNEIELIQRNPRLFTPRDFDYSPYFEIIKYPMLSTEEYPAYRRLPWMDEAISNDEGVITRPEIKKTKTEKSSTLSSVKKFKNRFSKKPVEKPSTKIPPTESSIVEIEKESIPTEEQKEIDEDGTTKS